jgi:3-oxoacyl-[acyl-carrier protein] reductase
VDLNLDGRRALVTGAARGIGLAVVRQLAQYGARVLATDIDERALQQAISEIPSALALPGDLTEAGFPDKLVSAACEQLGGLDILVNNAGYTWDNVIQKTSDEQFQAMLDIHVVAPFRLLRAAAGPIREAAKREAADGRRVMRKVVNISSISGLDGNPGQAGYASGKAAIVGLTKTLAKEWGRYNVNVNAVAFGLIDTRLTQPLSNPDARIEIHGHAIPVGVPPAALEAIKERCPLRRMGTPEEAAAAVLFFCSAWSDYVTGEVLVCSGGLRF